MENNINAGNAATQWADATNRKLAYRSIGKGKPIILCNRFRGNLDDWDPAFLDALAQHYRVITFNYSGLATSTGTPATSVLDLAHDVKDLAMALQLDNPAVLGWSLGGFVAEIVATEIPDLASHIILIGTRPPGHVKHEIEDIFTQTAYKPSYTVEDETILFFEPASESSRKAAQRSHDRIAARAGEKDAKVLPELWTAYANAAEDFDKDPYGAREKIKTLQTPMLIVSSDHEVCFPPENWFELNRQMPSAQLMVISQTGHGPQHQYPELIAAYIHHFIQQSRQ